MFYFSDKGETVNRICIEKITGKLIEMQGGGDDRPDLMEARLDTLKQNALKRGYKEADIEARWVDDAEWEAMKAAIDAPAVAAAEELQTAKDTAITDALPSWAQVETACGNISTLADAKAYLLKLSRVVYLLAKNKVE